MDEKCIQLLEGKLVSPFERTRIGVTFNNQLPIPVRIIFIPYIGFPTIPSGDPNLDGITEDGADIPAETTLSNLILAKGWYFKIINKLTGGLVQVLYEGSPLWRAGTSVVNLSMGSLNRPNDAGPIPLPSVDYNDAQIFPDTLRQTHSTVLLPTDSARVVVGLGKASNHNLIVREQYWERHPDSVCLAGGEKRTVSVTTSQGKQQTSSSSDTVSASIDASASAGWGAASASISSSLSATSTTFQQVTITEETTSYVSVELHNRHDEPIMFLRWQLNDVITIFHKEHHKPIASIIQAEAPVVVAGPYWTKAPSRPPIVES